MLKELKFAESGMGITEGTIAKWHKAEGDRITGGEILVEIETAKAITEVPAPAAGVLESIMHATGAAVEVDTTLALLRLDGAA